MASKKIPPAKVERLVAEWRTGEYSQRELAKRHKVSNGFVAKHTKGVVSNVSDIVNRMVSDRLALAEHTPAVVSAVNNAVDERTRHLVFFNNAGMILAQAAVKRVQADPDMPMQDMRHASEVVSKQRDGVLGKSPDVAVQINNAPSQGLDVSRLSTDVLAQILDARDNAIIR
jgi:hypothetical protein